MSGEVIHAVGKRKTAVARIWMKEGNGIILINKRPINDYLARETDRMIIKQPLELTETLGKYDFKINVRGGGSSGQAGAIRHGISRALVMLNPDLRISLKRAAFLTRDPRMKERKKYGRPGARKRFQYSKR
ncbi:MAG: 30S ribosomal protein S9 [Pseudomonadota bacterium]